MPPTKRYDEDLFEDTKMSFGEHLEELRGSLLKAVIALAVGFAIGLYFGDSVVRLIQEPLQASLERFYQHRATEKFRRNLDSLPDDAFPPEKTDEKPDQKTGEKPAENTAESATMDAEPPTPAELRDRREAALVEFMEQNRLTFEEVMIDPQLIFGELRVRFPKELANAKLPQKAAGNIPTADSLVPIYLWRRLEDDPRTRTSSFSTQEVFVIWIKASLLTGVVLASPFIFYYIWQFVAAGLYPHEKKYVTIFLPVSIGLFLAGAALAFFFVFGFVLDYLFSFNAWLGIDPDPRISEWLSFAIMMPLGFGISFQLPLVMLFLERIGVFSVAAYLAKWRIAVLVIAILAMVLTPAEPMSMIMMGVPLVALYFLGIALCYYLPKNRNPFDEAID